MIKLFLNALENNKKNIMIATAIFTVSIVFGYFLNQNNLIIKEMLKQLEGVARDIGERNSALYTIYKIFVNNLFASLLMIGLGIIFGIMPMIILFTNGMLIGYFLKIVLIDANMTLSYFLVGILPHGILELPAIIIAASFGMKVGFNLIKSLIWSLSSSVPIEKARTLIISTIKQTSIATIGITLTLFIAAIIESTLTIFLLSYLG